MSAIRKLFKAVIFFFSKLSQKFLSTVKRQIIWLLKTLFATNRRRGTVNAGFVLPTVAMVALVVVLLTTAILFRSFERSKNASNVRVNEATLNAATPAIDRARAKLNKLFQDGRLPRATPTDDALYSTLTTNINEYTFGDETTLKLALSEEEIEALGDDEQEDKKFLDTAWQYPVDTDNNGKFDSYTLYGIYFKNPLIKDGAYSRARNSLEARTPPMTAGSVNGDCGDTLGTSATLVGNTGWFTIGGKLKKAFFAYTATVPITSDPTDATNYEKYKGNKGFSALEYQQERVQLPLVNNAVIYEDDINLTPGPAFRLNGRIFTNSNFLTGAPKGAGGVTLYQVSSKTSCFYEDDNAKIILGGNLGAGGFTDVSDLDVTTKVHLYKGKSTDPDLTPEVTANKSVSEIPSNIAYNSLAYVQRINRLVEAQTPNNETSDPQEVKDGIAKQQQNTPGYTSADTARFRQQQLYTYFKRRTRRVPYAEVPFNSALSVVLGTYETATPLPASGDLRPPDAWIYPTDPTDGKTATSYSKLTLNLNGTDKLKPAASEPTELQKQGIEKSLGDRFLIGNNLPELWWKGTSFVGPNPQDTQDITGIKWDDNDGIRNRRTRIEQLADLGATDRDGDWELAAAKIPTSPQDPVGGLRVVTGAGIYLPSGFTTTTTDFSSTVAAREIWSDMMPVASQTAASNTGTKDSDITLPNPGGAKTPYLRMRATVVYHYNIASYNNLTPAPIACVSSYYDPTNSTRAKNLDLATIPFGKSAGGASNNGIVYPAPAASGETTYAAALTYQTLLKYPNERWVNEPLKNALAKTAANRTLSERSAVESALCALQILDETIGTATNSVIPHGAIMETAFLDARQIKAIHQDQSILGVETFTNTNYTLPNGTNVTASVPDVADYNLSKEQRQPLEIRATVLDIGLLKGQTISGGVTTVPEYLLPNSGIIYATRDDALLDASATGVNQKTVSPVDFILDPTRRPNGIMLINGNPIWRTLAYRDVEKGLILASNLPVYIKGDFNKHTQEEFTTALADDWSNFYTRPANERNPQFACRAGDPRLKNNCNPNGDAWRPASVLADAITLLSSNFREGFRNEGDYDLNNNLGDSTSIIDFKNRGFSTNAYVTNANWYNTSQDERGPKDFVPKLPDGVTDEPTFQGSSYLTNLVTPVQRRGNFNEYLMEVCPKLPVSACGSTGWFVKIDPANALNNQHSWNIVTDGTTELATSLNSGTTANPVTFTPVDASAAAATAAAAVTAEYQHYPRRVAFKRNSSSDLVLDSSGRPTPLGINGSGYVAEFPYSGTNFPRLAASALWFRTTTTSSNPTTDNSSNQEPPDNYLLLADVPTSANLQDQPRLIPILQINTPFGTPQNGGDGTLKTTPLIGPDSSNKNYDNNWLQRATETTFNLAAAAGDTPARPTEDNGGLHNFVRFIENWNWAPNADFTGGTVADAFKARISGSFIQFKRSAYATGPFSTSLTADYEYPIKGNNNRTPFYLAPKRQWGYDVGLLSQSPDLFAQKLVRTPDDLPDEYFREVGRDDAWVKALLCAKKTDDTYAIDADQRSCD
jgi:type II secretory pathway pseudopilin PulG